VSGIDSQGGVPKVALAVRWQLAGAVLAGFVVWYTAPYLSTDRRYAFLVERQALTDGRLWYTCFYLHVLAGIVALLTAPPLLWSGSVHRVGRLHRVLGKVHLLAVLGWLVPTGAGLTPFAKGGVFGQIAFALLVAFLACYTVLGLRALRRADLAAHARWMVRSYAVLLSAAAFRIVHTGIQHFVVDWEDGYAVATWLSLLLSLAAGEVACRRLKVL
jgi:hypothetical protein